MADWWETKKETIERLFELSQNKRPTLDSDVIGIRDKLLRSVQEERELVAKIKNFCVRGDKMFIGHLVSISKDKNILDTLETLKGLNRRQIELLKDSLAYELKNITDVLNKVDELLTQQYGILSRNPVIWGKSRELSTLFEKEGQEISKLKSQLNEETDLQAKIIKDLESIKEVKDTFLGRGLLKVFSKLILRIKKTDVYVMGNGNFPTMGSCIFAFRHFHGDIDPHAMMKVIPRKAYYLMAIDWMEEGMREIAKIISPSLGAIPIIRPDSPYIKDRSLSLNLDRYQYLVNLLRLGQVLVIFPEGYAKIDGHRTLQKDREEIQPIKQGVFRFTIYAQKSLGYDIPIIPVGTYYAHTVIKEGDAFRYVLGGACMINFGNPFTVNSMANDADIDVMAVALRQKLLLLSQQAEKQLRSEHPEYFQSMGQRPAGKEKSFAPAWIHS